MVAKDIIESVNQYDIQMNSNLLVIDNSSCRTDVCEHVVNVSSTFCNLSEIITVSVSATNGLGVSPSSDPGVIGMAIYNIIYP